MPGKRNGVSGFAILLDNHHAAFKLRVVQQIAVDRTVFRDENIKILDEFCSRDSGFCLMHSVPAEGELLAFGKTIFVTASGYLVPFSQRFRRNRLLGGISEILHLLRDFQYR